MISQAKWHVAWGVQTTPTLHFQKSMSGGATSSCPLTHIRMSIKNTEIHFQTYHDFEIKTFWILGYFSLENPFRNDLWMDAKTCQRLSSSPCSKALERVFPERHSNFLGRVIIIFFCSTELWHDSLLRIMMSLSTLWQKTISCS